MILPGALVLLPGQKMLTPAASTCSSECTFTTGRDFLSIYLLMIRFMEYVCHTSLTGIQTERLESIQLCTLDPHLLPRLVLCKGTQSVRARPLVSTQREPVQSLLLEHTLPISGCTACWPPHKALAPHDLCHQAEFPWIPDCGSHFWKTFIVHGLRNWQVLSVAITTTQSPPVLRSYKYPAHIPLSQFVQSSKCTSFSQIQQFYCN